MSDVLHHTKEGDQLTLPGDDVRRVLRIPGRQWSCPMLHREVLPVSVLAHRCTRCARPMFPIVNGEPAPAPAAGLALFAGLEEA